MVLCEYRFGDRTQTDARRAPYKSRKVLDHPGYCTRDPNQSRILD
jgi:hypothetical protein